MSDEEVGKSEPGAGAAMGAAELRNPLVLAGAAGAGGREEGEGEETARLGGPLRRRGRRGATVPRCCDPCVPKVESQNVMDWRSIRWSDGPVGEEKLTTEQMEEEWVLRKHLFETQKKRLSILGFPPGTWANWVAFSVLVIAPVMYGGFSNLLARNTIVPDGCLAVPETYIPEAETEAWDLTTALPFADCGACLRQPTPQFDAPLPLLSNGKAAGNVLQQLFAAFVLLWQTTYLGAQSQRQVAVSTSFGYMFSEEALYSPRGMMSTLPFLLPILSITMYMGGIQFIVLSAKEAVFWRAHSTLPAFNTTTLGSAEYMTSVSAPEENLLFTPKNAGNLTMALAACGSELHCVAGIGDCPAVSDLSDEFFPFDLHNTPSTDFRLLFISTENPTDPLKADSSAFSFIIALVPYITLMLPPLLTTVTAVMDPYGPIAGTGLFGPQAAKELAKPAWVTNDTFVVATAHRVVGLAWIAEFVRGPVRPAGICRYLCCKGTACNERGFARLSPRAPVPAYLKPSEGDIVPPTRGLGTANANPAYPSGVVLPAALPSSTPTEWDTPRPTTAVPIVDPSNIIFRDGIKARTDMSLEMVRRRMSAISYAKCGCVTLHDDDGNDITDVVLRAPLDPNFPQINGEGPAFEEIYLAIGMYLYKTNRLARA